MQFGHASPKQKGQHWQKAALPLQKLKPWLYLRQVTAINKALRQHYWPRALLQQILGEVYLQKEKQVQKAPQQLLCKAAEPGSPRDWQSDISAGLGPPNYALILPLPRGTGRIPFSPEASAARSRGFFQPAEGFPPPLPGSSIRGQCAALEAGCVRVSHPGAGSLVPPRARCLPAVPQRRRRRTRPPPSPGTGSPEPCLPHPASQAASGQSCRAAF